MSDNIRWKTIFVALIGVMTLVSGNIFTITVDGGFSSLIFVRRNSTNTETWNQTADLSYPPSFNLYTITGWDSGQWGTYSI